MATSLRHISAISLFVEDLAAAKAFYARVFDARLVYEDDASAAFAFGGPPPVVLGLAVAGSRFQLSFWVDDVDAVCAALRAHGVAPLTGPQDRPWGMRTANFVDPAGHSWEVAQRIASD